MEIYHPLQYTVIMNWRECIVLVIATWACGFFLALVHLVLFLKLAFCGFQDVNHFCEILKVACCDAWIKEVFIFTGAVFILVGPLSLILVSYMHIIWAILKIRTKEGCRKAFSTFSSHFCVVGFNFGIAVMVYLVPDDSQCEEEQKILTLFYTLLHPLLNPLINSLRNAQRAI